MSDDKPKLEFKVDFMTKRPIPLHIARISLGNHEGGSAIRLLLMPDGVHAFITNSKFVHIADEPEDVEFCGFK